MDLCYFYFPIFGMEWNLGLSVYLLSVFSLDSIVWDWYQGSFHATLLNSFFAVEIGLCSHPDITIMADWVLNINYLAGLDIVIFE